MGQNMSNIEFLWPSTIDGSTIQTIRIGKHSALGHLPIFLELTGSIGSVRVVSGLRLSAFFDPFCVVQDRVFFF